MAVTQDLINRVSKTIGEAAAAVAAALVLLPHASTATQSYAVIGGSGLAAVLLNVGIQVFTKTKSARVDRFTAAVDAVLDARLAAQKVEDPAPVAGADIQP